MEKSDVEDDMVEEEEAVDAEENPSPPTMEAVNPIRSMLP